jgi:hypothetical protein
VRETGVEPARLAALEPKDSLGAHEDTKQQNVPRLDTPACNETREAGGLAHPPVPSVDPVEAALASGLAAAAAAGQWTTVCQLARELEARREKGSPNGGAQVLPLLPRKLHG